MANRFNDRERFNDRDREDQQNYSPRKDRERSRFEGQQGRSQDWRGDFSGQEDMDWYQTSGSQYPNQYSRGQEGRYENRGSEIEGSRFTGRQERFGNQELNRGWAGERQYGRGFEHWEDPEASRWGFRESSRPGNLYSDEFEGGYQQQGQQRFNQGFNQRQGFSGEGQEIWRSRGQQGRFLSGQQSFGTEGTTGRFIGRGPKNYRRSDDRILEDINERLTQHPDIDASEIEVQVTAGEVILQGTVENRETKRKAEDIAESVSGVNDVQNQIKVSKNQEGSTSNQYTFGQHTSGQRTTGLGSTGIGTGGSEGMSSQHFEGESGKNKGTSNKDK